ncbi:glycosyltransferase family protein [Roseomonas marmotae]|uniref:Glycosyltransferase n=1 Tax=Roseomonas marmotae TaxID=2768161 RepID=A0ABS3KF54_9PROT|nr:hypothetical protein [Roseomonas marmotae]MBO1076108.1 hypothetical protein [Roseomonas marmotae]QTI81344.1 hypothetical protein IAI58_18490 [Roseomonas marmotae]
MTAPRPALLLLSAPDSPDALPLMRALSEQWQLSHQLPAALASHRPGEEVAWMLRRQAARADLVLHLSADGAAATAGLEGLVEVYAPAEPALCRLSDRERLDPLAWEALWRRERDLVRRARLVVVSSPEAALVMRLLYGVTAARLRQAPLAALPGLLPLAFAEAPEDPDPEPFTLALNDYPVRGRHSGGAVRVRQGLAALGQATVLLCLGGSGETAVIGPGLVQVCLPKGQDQRAMEADLLTLTGDALEDIATAMHASAHAGLVALAADLATRARVAVFEHCYLAPLLDAMQQAAPGLPAVYDAHNVETALKRELLREHPAREALCGFVAETERRLLARSALVLACSDGDAEAFRPAARQLVLFPHGILPASNPSAPPAEEAAPRIGFIGSGHPPNVAAARFITEALAPRFPAAIFEFIGGVCAALDQTPANIRLHGTLPEEEKSLVMAGWTLALNPVESGGGASLKVADYLAHGLPSLNTPHAARGFPLLRKGAGIILPLVEFAPALHGLLAAPQSLRPMARAACEAAAALNWPEAARAAREAIRRLAAAYRPPPPPPPILLLDEAGLRGTRARPGAARLDVLTPTPSLSPLADRIVTALPVHLRDLPGDYGIGASGQQLARCFGLCLPPGTRRLALDLRAAAPVRLRLVLRTEAGTWLLLRTRVEASCRLELALPENGRTAPRLEAEQLSGPASALRLRAVLLREPQRVALPLPEAPLPREGEVRQEAALAAWTARHGHRYAPVPDDPEQATAEALSSLLRDAASTRRVAALREALGITQPFILLLGGAPLEAAPPELPAVRHDGADAFHQDADGVLRRAPLPLAGLILPRWPACRGILPGNLPAAQAEAVRRLAAWADVPVLEERGSPVSQASPGSAPVS